MKFLHKEDVLQVLEAGRLAPYAGLANKGTHDFRRFFVISSKSEKLDKIRAACFEMIKGKIGSYEKENNDRMQTMLNVMRMIAQKGLPQWSAPYLVIVAERRGYPAREEIAMAYCLQNMWLKATALGLGMQIVSAISDLNADDQLSEMLGLPSGEFSFDACMIGYPAEQAEEKSREEPKLSVEWMD